MAAAEAAAAPEGVTSTSTRPRALVVAPHASYRTAAFIDGARRLGCDVLIASQGAHSIVGAYADGLHLDFNDSERALARILDAAATRPFAGIIATDDSTTELAARAAEALGLPHNPPEAVRIARRKDLARARLASAGVPVPRHWRIDLNAPLPPQLAEVTYPCVVKPVALSASRGVIRTDDAAALAAACARVARIVGAEPIEAERRFLLIEQFIPGIEVAVEGMLYGGRLELLAVFDKPDPLDGPYFEETYYITPSRLPPETIDALHACIHAACVAYGLREGPIHAECRINDRGVWILEVAARTIGGLCARLLQIGTGFGVEELVLAHAMRRSLTLAHAEGGAGVLMIPIPEAGILRRVEGIAAARAVPGIEDVIIYVREGYELVPLPEGASYLGFIYARADTPVAAEMALRKAHACLHVVVAPLFQARVAS